MSDTPSETRFRATGLDCGSRAAKIDTAMRHIRGIAEVAVSYSAESLAIRHGGSVATEGVVRQVGQLGFGVVPAGSASEARPGAPAAAKKWRQAGKRRAPLAGVGAGATAYAVGHVFPATERVAFILARIVKREEEAQGAKASTERFIDRFSRVYTPVVVVVAAALRGRVADMIALAKATMRNIHANVAVALGLKEVFLVIGVTAMRLLRWVKA